MLISNRLATFCRTTRVAFFLNINFHLVQRVSKPSLSPTLRSSFVCQCFCHWTTINGIGAATQRFLAKKGITSFAQIASMDNGKLQDLFNGAGNRFQLLNTETWAEQARELLNSSADESQPNDVQPNSQSKLSITSIVSSENTGLNLTNQQFSN